MPAQVHLVPGTRRGPEVDGGCLPFRDPFVEADAGPAGIPPLAALAFRPDPLERLERDIAATSYELDVSRQGLDGIVAELPEHMRPGRNRKRDGWELDRGIDLGR